MKKIKEPSDIFAAYLRNDGRRAAGDSLVDFMANADRRLEAELLADYLASGERWLPLGRNGGVWRGSRCWMGPGTPGAPTANDLWFDTVELSLSVLVPRPPDEIDSCSTEDLEQVTPFVGWLAIRPVAVWQVLGFARATAWTPPAEVAGQPPATYASGLTGVETDGYVTFFGKALAGPEVWSAAAAAVSPAQLSGLWPEDHDIELGDWYAEGMLELLRRGYATQPGLGVTVKPERPEYSVEEADRPGGACFRTTVSAQIGLLPPQIDEEWGDEERGEVLDRGSFDHSTR
ncbi:hypothetical protein [Frankia tisae]|uniref:hypothetical protein n=1 Tax=Frankia tisae TaxID=2950104 RepID=UPI0021C156F7|nr:hypothetical protein [Frankia tisae]